MREAEEKGQQLCSTRYKYDFYTAPAVKRSSYRVMNDKQLAQLELVLLRLVKVNVCIDNWYKEKSRTKLHVAVKRLPWEYENPPDMQKLATKSVIKQAEMLQNNSLIQQ